MRTRQPDDPIFAAIEAHRAAHEHVHVFNADNDGEILDGLSDAEFNALVKLLAMTPTTPGGCAAMLRYVAELANREEIGRASQPFSGWAESVKEPAATLLGRIAAVIEHAERLTPRI